MTSFFMDRAADAMAIVEHGAAYKGQQDHQFGKKNKIDFFEKFFGRVFVPFLKLKIENNLEF